MGPRRRTALAIAVAAAGAWAAPPAQARAPAGVSILATRYRPAVVVVPAGATVRWRDDDSRPHGLEGDVRSGRRLNPGETFSRRFAAPGQYDYRDADNAAMRGTVVVESSAGGVNGGGSVRPPRLPRGRGFTVISHGYRATATLDLHESMDFYDSQWQSTQGPCNAEVGHAERTVHLVATLPRVHYSAVPRLGIESLLSSPAVARWGRYLEATQAQVGTSATALVNCPDGRTRDRAPTQPANCNESFGGRPLRLLFGWTPAGSSRTRNRFTLSGRAIGYSGFCPPNLIGALAVAGVDPSSLPLAVVGSALADESASTSPATVAEVRALRTGRAVTIRRAYDLHFTTDCCEGYNPGPGGAAARVGGVHASRATLTVRLTPR